jgi:hypothetical protein
LIIVHPVCLTPHTLDAGMTAAIACRAAAMRPGQSSEQAIASTYTSRGPCTMCPSPRYTAYERVLFVENADSGEPEGGVNGGLRVHGLIFPHATDIYATLL